MVNLLFGLCHIALRKLQIPSNEWSKVSVDLIWINVIEIFRRPLWGLVLIDKHGPHALCEIICLQEPAGQPIVLDQGFTNGAVASLADMAPGNLQR